MVEEIKKKTVGFLEEHAGEGFEGITSQDYTIPFIRILQILTPQAQEDNDAYVRGAKPGMFFNTITERLYGTTIQVIPLIYKKIWLEWAPNRGGLMGRHEPESLHVDKGTFTSWKLPNGNEVAEHHAFYVLVLKHFDEGPTIISLTSTGIKHAKNWNTQIMMTRLPSGSRAPYYASVWELETIKRTNQQGVWYQIGDRKSMIKRIRFITEQEFTEFIFPIKESLISLKNVDYSQLEDTREEENDNMENGETTPF
ncbi:hypothetical protein LCGC14_0521350 [marine sediment metagenome]|uniref:Uncharacterized protein n=1 Tax=marine sediment metagenome TaxID=412755 RepID=A0A0F9RYE7_9ZZZZ